MKNQENNDRADAARSLVECADIQAVLFDYMTRELGDSRSGLIREHLRKCEACQAAATEIQTTLDMLKAVPEAEKGLVPAHLTRERRDRLIWAFTHPMLDWMYAHHILVSVVLAILMLAALCCAMRQFKAWQEPETDGPTIRLFREAPTNDLPDAAESPEEERKDVSRGDAPDFATDTAATSGKEGAEAKE